MEAQPRSACPEPTLPPGLSREQAWAWALDNFPALSRPSCDPRPFLPEPSRGPRGPLRPPGPRDAEGPAAERGLESDPDPQAPQRETPAPARTAQRPRKQPGGARTPGGDGGTRAAGPALSPSRPHPRPAPRPRPGKRDRRRPTGPRSRRPGEPDAAP